MNINEKQNKNKKAINQNLFLMLLKNLKIEEAIEMYVKDDVQIDYIGKQRSVLKTTWIRYLKATLLNKLNKVVQFKIEPIGEEHDNMAFKIFMICKKHNNTFEFTEIRVVNNWQENYINKTQYQLISH
jgi:hypothetical protein